MANVTMHKGYALGELRINKPGMTFLMTPVTFIASVLLAWQERLNERAALREIDSHLLRDMGISAEEAQKEAAKPFWSI
ncbi:DUF1127 domain-containing protein [Kiloniella laminariae]|uniref:DUF1127 domain-containing protein n=1 Tax=Kiloniella laminariae TaxID=454162 RepID=UPI00037FA2F1|nr:DUF1127 domain-containing protein [Kiloniella laminariae]